MSELDSKWWASLNHGGMLIAPARVHEFFGEPLAPLTSGKTASLRRHVQMSAAGTGKLGDFLDAVLEDLLGLDRGSWLKANAVDASWSRKALTGETLKPRRVWQGPRGEVLPVFTPDRSEVGRLGVHRGRTAVARVIEWLRLTDREIALLTNGRQWRLIHAGAHYDAFCEWDIEQWFEEGEVGPQVEALRRLLGRPALTIRDTGEDRPPLVRAILASRKGQGELSAVLGERVRQAVERLLQASSPVLEDLVGDKPHQVAPKHAYIAATRLIMRLVVVLFAEARELLPVQNPIYHGAYGLQGLREELERSAGGRAERLRHRFAAWPRLLSLFQLIYRGSGHEDLLITRYGGGLFRAGDAHGDAVSRALHALEHPSNHLSDATVHRLIELLTRSKVRVRQGKSSVWVDTVVDFSNLSSEYIGILYEGLLDYELRRADAQDPMVFLDIGNQPALPFSRLDAMTVKQRKDMFEKLAKASKSSKSEEGEDEDEQESEDEQAEATEDDGGEPAAVEVESDESDDTTRVWHEKVDTWARKAVRDVGLVKRGADFNAPEVIAKAKQLVRRVVLPREWFLVRWGGTRKGAGTFYTPPMLAGPTVRRTLQPLTHAAVKTSRDATSGLDEVTLWQPKLPEEILKLKVCDPAMGSGSFLISALHWLTDALYQSLIAHDRIARRDDGSIAQLADGAAEDGPWAETLWKVPPEHPDFEAKLRARLKRHVVERCIHGVDIDPVAVELARLALWVETMDEGLPFEFLDHKLKIGNALVGCWYDRFRGYPITAWEREGGDKGHTNFVHHVREATNKKGKVERKGDVWTYAIKQRKSQIKQLLVDVIHDRPQTAWESWRYAGAAPNLVLDEARVAFELLHGDRRDPERQSESYKVLQGKLAPLRESFDTWCALWFWPGDALDEAPTPPEFHNPGHEARKRVRALREEHRFFHWEIEFADVFTGEQAGFHAIVGNPPWDIQKPNSKEFFSNIDPLYRSLGKQEALRWQESAFEDAAELERQWVAYQARFKALSNWVGWVGNPFGDPQEDPEHAAYSLSRKDNAEWHRTWREMRGDENGYADAHHPFRHQGSADLNSYKLFVECGHALLAQHGRLGMVVPSGLYTDKGTGALRELLLDQCRWEWLFGFENRDKIFDIHRSFKFAAVVAQKSGKTAEVQAAFMRRETADWSMAHPRVLPYPRERIAQFSPKSKAILELSAERDLVVLQKLYSNGVLLGDTGLGDTGSDGWGIEYVREFDMTNDSKLFAPRPKWESKGYVPDEYGHWLVGGWRPYRGPKSLLARKQGLVLSRDGERAISVSDIEDVALPLYEGRMIGQFDFSEKGWVSGTGRSAVWREIDFAEKLVEPQYLMKLHDCMSATDRHGNPKIRWGAKVAFMDVTASTNVRTMIAATVRNVPCGNSAPILGGRDVIALNAVLGSIVYDYIARARCGGLHLNWFVIEESPLVDCVTWGAHLSSLAIGLSCCKENFAPTWLSSSFSGSWRSLWALSRAERLRRTCMIDAITATALGLSTDDMRWVLSAVDYPREDLNDLKLNPKGFWRVDKDQPPELRHTVLAQVAFQDLQRDGLDHFLNQPDGEGWMLPETLRLADYGLGHDDRAKQPQPVASVLGPRFYDWQLAQSVAESWEECERHAELLDQILPLPKPTPVESPEPVVPQISGAQGSLFGDEAPPPKRRRKKT